jgi:hypothetical protein
MDLRDETMAGCRRAWSRSAPGRLGVLVLMGVFVAGGVLAGLAGSAQAGPCDVATKTWDRGAGTDSWHDAANWAPDGVPGSSDHVCIPAGSPGTLVTTSSAVTVASVEAAKDLRVQSPLTLTSTGQASLFSALLDLRSDLAGDADRTVAGTLDWRSGIISGSGVTTVSDGGSLVASASTGTQRLASSLVTAGSVTLTHNSSGPVVYLDNGRWENTGSLTVAMPAGYSGPGVGEWAFGQTNLVRNLGTITKTGLYTFDIGVPLDNDGTVDAQQGTLRLSTPSPGVEEPTGDYKASGTGTLDIASTLTLAQGATLGALPGATVQLNADLVADGAVTVPNGRTLTWRSGIISGSGTTTVGAGGSLVASSNTGTRRLASSLVTAGSVTLTHNTNTAAVVYLDNGTWENTGSWTVTTTGGWGGSGVGEWWSPPERTCATTTVRGRSWSRGARCSWPRSTAVSIA